MASTSAAHRSIQSSTIGVADEGKSTVQFNILGPLEVVDHGSVVPLGGVKPRAMLGMLLLRANRVVPSSKLLDSLWVGGVPPTARKMLQNAASALRDVLARDGGSADPPVLLTHTPGYLLHIEPGTIDLNRFTRHTEQGRAYAADDDWEAARQELRSALGVWRGPVLADLTEASTVWPEAVEIQRTQLVVTEELFDAELACGRHREVVAEIESVAGRELSHERLVAQLMLALYRCGRQLDALEVYRRARTSLIETHGLEPSRELQELERSILNQDTALDWRGGAVPVIGDGVPARAERPAADLAGPAMPAAALPGAAPAVPVRPAVPADGGEVATPAPGRQASLMAVLSEVDRMPGSDAAAAAAAFDLVAEIVDHEASRYGGVVVSRVASVSWVVFDDSAGGAVDAGLAIQAALTTPRQVGDAADGQVPQVTVKIAVVSTDAALGYQPGDGTLRGLDSAVVGQCLQLASAAPAGRVRVGEETKRATERCVRYEWACDGAWDVVERLPEALRLHKVKMVIGDPGEIQKLYGLLSTIDDGRTASWLNDRTGRGYDNLLEEAVAEVTISVWVPADDVPS